MELCSRGKPAKLTLLSHSCLDSRGFTDVYIIIQWNCSHVNGSLLPRHGASSDCGWRRRPLDLEGGCDIILNKQSWTADKEWSTGFGFRLV
jgi:hypothetical protein